MLTPLALEYHPDPGRPVAKRIVLLGADGPGDRAVPLRPGPGGVRMQDVHRQDAYRLFGIELSPYSVKVRAYLRFKQLPHVWLTRDASTQAEFERYARLPLVPLVVSPAGDGLQDSTPIIEELERRHPEPSIRPESQLTGFVSDLLEEFADEWGNKWMFHYRWARDVDQWSAAGRIARIMQPTASDEDVRVAAERVRARMIGRMGFVGSNEQTGPLIERSFQQAIGLLEAHLERRPYLLGARPALADFGLFGELYEAWTDPTAGALIEARAPALLAWIQRMCFPDVEGPFEAWSDLRATLLPLLRDQVAKLFLPWSAANEQAIQQRSERFELPLDGSIWTQQPQKYHAKSLAVLREKYAECRKDVELGELMRATGCHDVLAARG